jgi:hypothetical protein
MCPARTFQSISGTCLLDVYRYKSFPLQVPDILSKLVSLRMMRIEFHIFCPNDHASGLQVSCV